MQTRMVCLENCYMYVSPGEHNTLALPMAIPVGTILECQYEYNYFTYTNYNGVSGWVVDLYMMTGGDFAKVARKIDRNIITTGNVSLYEYPEENARELEQIPQNTELHADFSYEYGNYGMEGYYFVEYNNVKGWIPVEKFAVEDAKYPFEKTINFTENIIINGEVIIKKGETVNLYSKYFDTGFYGQDVGNPYFIYNGKGIWGNDLGIHYPENKYIVLTEKQKDLPVGEKLKIKYYIGAIDNSWIESKYIVEYNDAAYELADFSGIVMDEDELIVYEATKDIEIRKLPSNEVETTTLKKGARFYRSAYGERLHNYSPNYFGYLTTEDGLTGFAKMQFEENCVVVARNVKNENLSDFIKTDTKDEMLENENITIDSGDTEVINKDESTVSVDEWNEDSGENKVNIFEAQMKKKELSKLTAAILGVCAGVILAITAFVALKLINRKSQTNNESSDDKYDEL